MYEIITILSDWYFYSGWDKMFPEIRFSTTFDDISSLLENLLVYRELIKIEGFDAFTLTLFIVNDITEEISNLKRR